MSATRPKTGPGLAGKEPKKLVIKPLKFKPELPGNFEEVTWAKLQEAVRAVHCKRKVSTSLEELYMAVQDMCMHKMAERLYQGLQQECDAHVGLQVASLQRSASLDPVTYLDRLDATWRDHCEAMLTIRHIFLYLDRTHVLASGGSGTGAARSLFDMGLQLLGKHLVERPEVEQRAIEGLLILIERERTGDGVDRSLLQSLLRMLHHLGTYPTAFQAPFLQHSARFYQAEGTRLMSEVSVPEYLKHCETRLGEEYERCAHYLDSATRKPLIHVVEQQLVSEHLPTLLERGFGALMDAHRVEDVARLYGLAGRVGALEALRAAFKDYVRGAALRLVKDEEKGKDVFEAFYKKDLAKRLLLGKSASIDAEKSMISKLKAECGAQFTNKLEGMFKDIELSSDVMAAFRQAAHYRSKLPPGVDMSVSVLTSGFWPTYPITEAKLPQELEESQEVFKDFYLKKYSGRRLVWYSSLGTCVLRAQFPKGVKELSVSLFQAVVLALFNGADTLSLAELKQHSGIEDKELRRTLQSLACGKVRVLLKEPKGREVDDGDVFRFNDGFSEKLFRIKINSIQMKETEEENKKTNDQVVQDRQHQIDAAVVRIMKTRKQLSHKLLISEVLQQLKFPLKATDLKKRIESLIEREYLARDASDQNIYNYLA